MKSWHFFIALLFLIMLVILSLVFFRDALARVMWQKYQLPNVALLLVDHDVDLAMQLGNYYFNGGAYDTERAAEAYGKVLSIDPRRFLVHYQLARVLFVKGKQPEALKEINNELANNPANLRALYIRGLIEGYGGDLHAAEADFRRFIGWAPKEWAGYNDLLWILAKERKYRDMVAFAHAGIREALGGSENPWLWNMLGVAQLNLQEKKAARKAFIRAQELTEALTSLDWQRAYPGNDPAVAENGLVAFRVAIAENLAKTQ